jgi:hypothetical protein
MSRWVEQKFQGDRDAGMQLDACPRNFNRLRRTGAKHLA